MALPFSENSSACPVQLDERNQPVRSCKSSDPPPEALRVPGRTAAQTASTPAAIRRSPQGATRGEISGQVRQEVIERLHGGVFVGLVSGVPTRVAHVQAP